MALSIALYVIPLRAVSTDPILSAVFGGVLTGIGVGFVFRRQFRQVDLILLRCFLRIKKNFRLVLYYQR